MSEESTDVRIVKERAKPTFLVLGKNKKIASDLRWHPALMADHVIEKQTKWITIGELANVAFGNPSIANKNKVRQRLAGLFLELLNRGYCLIRTMNGRRIQAVKVLDPESVADRQAMAGKLDQLKRSAATSEEKWARAQELAAGWVSGNQTSSEI